ncbi:MAG TPA: RdgB/HAM1 family non-canonical purine NTP pyrophosphatase [Gammaproteobacteria bacterium]
MRRVVLASNNRGKVRELGMLLAGSGLEVIAQGELGVPEAEETAPTFVENALLKARNAAQHTGLPALADDSGLAVDALGGAPGVRSARYAGVDADDAANNRRLLAELDGLPPARRTARFLCLLVYLRSADDPVPLICQGSWEGVVLDAPRGANGFGYDPLFYLPERDRTSAELPPELKNRLSHRGQALRQLVERLAAAGHA